MKKPKAVPFALSFALISGTSAYGAVMYQIQSLGVLAPASHGPYDYRSYAINDSGTVLGQTTVGTQSQASLWQNGTINALGIWPGGTFSTGFAINNNGLVAAQLNDQFGNSFAGVKQSGGNWISGATIAGIHFTGPRGLNSSGQMVGVASSANFYSFPSEAMFHAPLTGKAPVQGLI